MPRRPPPLTRRSSNNQPGPSRPLGILGPWAFSAPERSLASWGRRACKGADHAPEPRASPEVRLSGPLPRPACAPTRSPVRCPLPTPVILGRRKSSREPSGPPPSPNSHRVVPPLGRSLCRQVALLPTAIRLPDRWKAIRVVAHRRTTSVRSPASARSLAHGARADPHRLLQVAPCRSERLHCSTLPGLTTQPP